jgi:hypothetical protein
MESYRSRFFSQPNFFFSNTHKSCGLIILRTKYCFSTSAAKACAQLGKDKQDDTAETGNRGTLGNYSLKMLPKASIGKESISSTAKSTHEGVGVAPAAHQTHVWAGSDVPPGGVGWACYSPGGRELGRMFP